MSNVANIAACGVSILIVALLIFLCNRRKAAVGESWSLYDQWNPYSNPYFVGRWELRTFLIVYLLTLPLQLITNTSLLPQGSMSLVVFTAIHAGLVVSLFWILIANAIVATQWIEDGTMASIAVRQLCGLHIIPSYSHFSNSRCQLSPWSFSVALFTSALTSLLVLRKPLAVFRTLLSEFVVYRCLCWWIYGLWCESTLFCSRWN